MFALALAAPALVVAAHGRHGQERHPGHPLKIGTVNFPNSGAAAAQEPFLRGIALLHSYEYFDARTAFQQTRGIDPGFALAYWAEALTYSQFDWGTEDLPAARAALERLAPSRDERLAKAGNPRERAFGSAIETFFAGGALLERALGFAESMQAYAAAAPLDVEAAAFAARGGLYVLRYAPPADRIQRAEMAIALAERVLAANPQHPGGVHYLIHATDSPRFAARGLAAARLYDSLAPDADHALHMPSHIFLQLGLWDDVAAANERAWTASRDWVARGGHAVSELGWHSLQWLQYGYLQQGRYRAARTLIDSASAILGAAPPDAVVGYPDARYAVETLAFQYGAETGRWDNLPHGAGAADLARRAASAPTPREQQMAASGAYQTAISAALGGDPAAAVDGARALRGLAVAGPPPVRGLAEGLASQVDAVVARTRGEHDTAIALLTRVATASRDVSVAPVGPPVVLPASELLGAVLLDSHRPGEAIPAYERALEERPNRSSALLGLARAKSAAGDRTGASAAYATLLANWAHADSDVAAVAEARSALAQGRK